MLSFEAARAKVIELVGARATAPGSEIVDIAKAPSDALGCLVASDIVADRNYPPFDRSTRDGYALRAADVASAAQLACLLEASAPKPGNVSPAC